MANNRMITYRAAGVDIDANDQMVDRIWPILVSTYGPRVMDIEGGFAGLFRLDYDERLFKKNYRNPVLVACTDGVGSKVLVAARMKRFDTVGIDLVAMSVNDMLVLGAEPLFFLDYLAVHHLDPAFIAELVKGIAAGCKMADCALIGGETAEMPDIYARGHFDMAGFGVGVAEKDRIIDGTKVRPGDIVLGLASSGLHSNGYALARHICFKQLRLRCTDRLDALEGRTVGEVLLESTRIYVRPIVRLLATYKVKQVVHAMVHITGGGLLGNIPRVVPKDCNVVLEKGSWPMPAIFRFLQASGPVDEQEMYRVFNMGIGFVLVVAEDFANAIARKLTREGLSVHRIGLITPGTGKVVLK
ncbi:MAG: phosphoribosylformylglycinamidine cyclo-ligase [Sedimentisphaerales bacterium]|nr:phosphoribosylformylglycinamidine cyclo-ligase [Sedimentisphaerales bacterium]